MDVTNVKALYFTGAGTTKQVTERFVQACGLPADLFDITPFGAEVPTCTAHDLTVFAVPSYGGRIPAPMAERISRISGDNTPAVLLVTYGNRAIDDTLIELADAVSERDVSRWQAAPWRHTIRSWLTLPKDGPTPMTLLCSTPALPAWWSDWAPLQPCATPSLARFLATGRTAPSAAFPSIPKRHPMCASAAEPVLRNAPCGQSTPLHRAPPISSAAFRACAASPPARWGHAASLAVTRLPRHAPLLPKNVPSGRKATRSCR